MSGRHRCWQSSLPRPWRPSPNCWPITTPKPVSYPGGGPLAAGWPAGGLALGTCSKPSPISPRVSRCSRRSRTHQPGAQQELAFHLALCAPLHSREGLCRPRSGQRLYCGRERCISRWARRHSFPRFYGDCTRLHHTRAEWQTAWKLVEQLRALAQRLQDPAILLEAHRALGGTSFFLGKFAAGADPYGARADAL